MFLATASVTRWRCSGFFLWEGHGRRAGRAQKEQRGPSPTPSGSEAENTDFAILLQTLFPPPLLTAPPPQHLALPVEEQGLDQGDDISAGFVSRTHDCHVQELGEEEALRLAGLGEDHGLAWPGPGGAAPQASERGRLGGGGQSPPPSLLQGGNGYLQGEVRTLAPPAGGHDARCCDSHGWPGGRAGAEGGRPRASRRQGPCTPTSHLGGSGRGRTQSERLWPPWSVCGSRSRPAAPRGCPSWGVCGASAQGKGPGPPRARRAHSRSPRSRKNPSSSSSSSSAAAPSARGRPRGSMAGRGALRAGRDSGLRAPSRALRIREGKRRVSLGRRSPDGRPFPSRAESPPHLSLRLGDPSSLSPKPGRVRGKGG